MAGYNPAQYESATRDSNYRHATDSANNAYGRFISQTRGERDLGDMTTSFRRSYPNFGAQFNQRGLAGPGISSGVQQQSMRNYLGDYYQNYGRRQQDLAQTLQGYDMNQNNINALRENEMANIQAQRSYAIMEAANSIAALQQYLGGTG